MFELERLQMQLIRERQLAESQTIQNQYYYYTNNGTLTKYPNNGMGAIPGQVSTPKIPGGVNQTAFSNT